MTTKCIINVYNYIGFKHTDSLQLCYMLTYQLYIRVWLYVNLPNIYEGLVLVIVTGCLGTAWILGCADVSLPVAAAVCSQCVRSLPCTIWPSKPSRYVDLSFCNCNM